MQFMDEEEIKKFSTQEPELSEAWRMLLGMQPADIQVGDQDGLMNDQERSTGDHEGVAGDHEGSLGDHKGSLGDYEGSTGDHKGSMGDHEGSPLLANDPWSHLVQAQGVQVIDLQQAHLHAIHTPLSDFDVEQALKMLQEQPIVNED